MTTIKCPICEKDVDGDGTHELNASLRDHLARKHKMPTAGETDLLKSGAPGGPSPGGQARPGEGGMGTMGKGTERRAEVPAMEREPTRPTGVGGVGAPAATTGGGKEEVDCPMCGRRLTGGSEDELTLSLQSHFREVHDIVPEIKAAQR